MHVAMLGNDYSYAYAPDFPGVGMGRVPMLRHGGALGCYLGQDEKSAAQQVLERAIDTVGTNLADVIRAIRGAPDVSLEVKQDAEAAARETLGTWFEKNQTFVIAGVVVLGVALVAAGTARRRRR